MLQKETVTVNSMLLLILIGVILLKDIRAHRVSNDNIFTRKRNAASNQNHNCLFGNSSHCSLVNLLANFTNNVTIYITTDMVLSSVIHTAHLKNIAIIGYNNPTVQCGYSGGLHFVSCHNVTIEGIIWNECGANANVNATQGIGYYFTKLHFSKFIGSISCTIRSVRKCKH